MPPMKKEGHIALYMYVGIPCAINISRTLCPTYFKLGR